MSRARPIGRHWLHKLSGFREVRSLPLTDRGWRYGMAVFETIRIAGGHAEFLPEHLDLLRAASRDCGFPEVDHSIEDAGGFLNGTEWPESGVARIHVTAGDGGPSDPVRRCRVYIDYEPRPLPADELHERGLRVVIHPRPHCPLFNGRKTHNYWPNVDALASARRARADEALLLDHKGRLVSACLGNVFLKFGNQLLTPAADCGARPGVIRGWLMANYPVREQMLEREDIERADGIFISNSWLGVMRARLGSGEDGRDLGHWASLRQDLLNFCEARKKANEKSAILCS